jgi:hypothetical protein
MIKNSVSRRTRARGLKLGEPSMKENEPSPKDVALRIVLGGWIVHHMDFVAAMARICCFS